MRSELLPYYERELTFIRQMAAEFAGKYPKVAGRLLLEPETCEDPHVERLIESFALLCGRVHHKLDDEFPEITEALLDVLYPHYLRPVPSMAIAQFESHSSQSAAASQQIPAGMPLHAKSEEGQLCSFRTCYPVTIRPLRVRDASLSAVSHFLSPGLPADTAAVLRIEMERTASGAIGPLAIGSLRFYLNGESAAMHALYELLLLHAVRVAIRPLPAREGVSETVLPVGCLRQVGFDPAEGLLPYSDRSFTGYRLLQEYFAFPEKFLFFDLADLDRVPWSEFPSRFEILIYARETADPQTLIALEQGVVANTFQLGCTPIVNLFERIAEPIRITQTRTEYRVVPDMHRQTSTEVYSVNRVTSAATYLEEPLHYAPFYALRHGEQEEPTGFWCTHRRPSFRKNDSGTEVFLSLVDLNFKPALPPDEVLTLRVTCTNRDEAARLKVTGEPGELQADGMALVQARFMRKPTAPLRPPMRRGLQWRLISHLSLNHLSIVDQGREALQEILRLYDFSGSPVIRKQIAGITAVSSRSSIARVSSDIGVAFCRGTDVTIEFDEDQYVGTGVFLLASVLRKFLGLYAAVNSYSRLIVKTRKGVLKQWTPVAGEQVLL